jgi:threonine dehydratase
MPTTRAEVVAGAGTLAMEIEAQGGRRACVLVSVGGGGLIGGIASWFGQRCPRGGAGAGRRAHACTARARRASPWTWPVSGIAADSLGAKTHWRHCLGGDAAACERRAAAARRAIRAAQLWLWNEMKLAVEPAAALGLAALQTGAYRRRADETVALILCGANLDPAKLA